jgi:hypothetical protein
MGSLDRYCLDRNFHLPSPASGRPLKIFLQETIIPVNAPIRHRLLLGIIAISPAADCNSPPP